MSQHVNEQQHGQPGLFDALGIFRRRRCIIGVGLFLGAAAAAGYYALSTEVYESNTRLLIVKKGATLPGPMTDAAGEFEQTVQEDLLATHMLILKSPRVIQRALEDGGLQNLPSVQRSLDEDQDEVEYVIENLRVTRGGEGQGRLAHVITLRFRHVSDDDCAAILNAIVNSYHSFIDEQLAAPVDDALILITEAKQQISQDLDQALANYQTFRESTSLIFKGAERLNVHQNRVEQLETALADVRLRRVETESRIQTTKNMIASGSKDDSPLNFERLALLEQHHFDGSNSSVARSSTGKSTAMLPSGRPELTETAKAEFNQLLTMMLEEGALLEEFGTHHPLVRQKRRNIEQMKQFLGQKRQQLEKAFVQLLHSDLYDLQRREQEIRKMLLEEEAAAKTLVRSELKDDLMRKEISRQQSLFDSIVARLDEIHLAKNYGGFASEMIAPVKSGELVSARLGLLMSLGTMMGLFLGLGLAVIVECVPVPREVGRVAAKRQSVPKPKRAITMPATV